MTASLSGASFVAHRAHTPGKRNLKKVPFVELHAGRLQGVVSSGSDISRVYVSWVEWGTGNFYCCTNNNRPCGGLRGSSCKHIDALFDNALAQFGSDRMAARFGDGGIRNHIALSAGAATKEGSGEVFSRFLDYLRYVDLGANEDIVPEMAWFVGG